MTDDARPNFFHILGLLPEQPWDEASYAQALSAKCSLWALQVQGDKDQTQQATIDAQRNLRLRREIERVMSDPRTREKERQAALSVRYDELQRRRRVVADQMDDMLEKGYLLDDEYEWLRRDDAVLADDALRQRLDQAERRPRGRGDERLDEAIEQDLRKHLSIIGQPDLYAALRSADPGAGEHAPADRLLTAADALERKARSSTDMNGPAAEATRHLADLARQVLGSPGLKRQHDATLRLWSLDALLDRYESSLEIAREISARQFEKFLREAAAKGIDIGVARTELIARFRRRGWLVDMPSAAVDATLRSEIRCPACSRLNDPASGHCAHCGRVLRYPCPRCDALVTAVTRVCSACGFRVGERDYVAHLIGQAEACLAGRDVVGADERAAEAAQLWPVPRGRSDELGDRLRAVRARIADLRAAQRDVIAQVDPLMDARKFHAAAQLLRAALATHPGLSGHLEECEDAIRRSDQFRDDARAPGRSDEKRAELYSAALRACADNDQARSELLLISLSPVIPGPISAKGHPPRMAVHEVELDSPAAGPGGEVRIVCAGLRDESPHPGAEFPVDDLAKYRTIERGDRDYWISGKEWLRRYTLVLVLYGRCYVGSARYYARGPDVADVRADHAGNSVRLTWTWPAEPPAGLELGEALVSWRDGTEIGDPVNATMQRYVSREPGATTGRCELPAAGRMFINVATVIRHQGNAYVTSGVRAEARRRPVTLKYQLRPGRGRRAMLAISVDGGRLDQLPALSLRARPDSQDGGDEVIRIPAGLAAADIAVKLEDRDGRKIEPRSCRLFAVDDPGGLHVMIIDPA